MNSKDNIVHVSGIQDRLFKDEVSYSVSRNALFCVGGGGHRTVVVLSCHSKGRLYEHKM